MLEIMHLIGVSLLPLGRKPLVHVPNLSRNLGTPRIPYSFVELEFKNPDIWKGDWTIYTPKS